MKASTKSAKFGKVAAVIGAIANGYFNIRKQDAAMTADPNLKFNWSEFFAAVATGALAAGAVGYGVGTILDYRNSKIKPINTDAYLQTLAKSIRLDTGSYEYSLVDKKATYLSDLLALKFKSRISGHPTRLGSTQRGTALKGKFDIDIAINFLSSSFSSTSKMRFAVFRYLNQLIGKNDIVSVRQQRNSIGVLFSIDGQTYRVDIVPVKITAGNRNSGYLSVNEASIFGDRLSYKKTNVTVLNRMRLTETQKRIVLLLKHWRTKNQVPLGSHLIENLVLDAYSHSLYIPKGFTAKVIMVVSHIATNLEVAVIRGEENTNNVLTDISDSDKSEIVSKCKTVIEEFSYQPNSTMKFF